MKGGKDKRLVKQLKSSAKKMIKLRADAKSIILVQSNGQVQEPTQQTVSLLGARPSSRFLKAQ